MQPDDIPALVKEAQRSQAAFAALYDRYLERVYRFHYSRTGDQPSAEDLTAQTFLTALERLNGYREKGSFTGWLFAIARSKFIDHYRREKPSARLDLSPELAGADDPAGDAEKQLELEKLAVIVRGLEPGEQEIIRLRYAAGLSFAELAEALGKREEAVKKSLYRLLAKVQSRMETP